MNHLKELICSAGQAPYGYKKIPLKQRSILLYGPGKAADIINTDSKKKALKVKALRKKQNIIALLDQPQFPIQDSNPSSAATLWGNIKAINNVPKKDLPLWVNSFWKAHTFDLILNGSV